MINTHMKRWNGWGLSSQNYPIPASAERYLVSTIGPGNPLPDATFEETISQVPKSSLPDRPDICTDEYQRLTHARGQSLPDWIALRSGDIDSFPDGVAFPPSTSATAELISFANINQIILIPYGGGTSVVGHINPTTEKAPTLTIDMRYQNKLIKLDSQSRLAWIQAGATGPLIEKQLNKSGFTLGHFPQSFEQSTLGGWIATRSCGQQSYYYGRIEDLLAGVTIETVAGRWSLLPYPASAAGPDLKHIVLGSEGTIGIITEAIVRIHPLPEVESFYTAFFQDWESGVRAVEQIAQAGIGVSMLRLSNPVETETTLQLSGRPKLVTFADFGLNTIGYSQERCLLIYAVTGGRKHTRSAYQQANEIIRAHKGLIVGKMIGRIWQKSRFRTPYLRNSLWDRGYALDTLETAVPWSFVLPTTSAIFNNLKSVMEEFSERGLIFSHLSHVYKDGASIYTTFLFPHGKSHAETLQRWQQLKLAASRAVIANQGTISHQHGVGLDHMPYLEAEKGSIGIGAIKAINKYLDPNGIFNPGKLVPIPD